MAVTPAFLFLVVAIVLAVLAAIGWPKTAVSLGWASLACLEASLLL